MADNENTSISTDPKVPLTPVDERSSQALGVSEGAETPVASSGFVLQFRKSWRQNPLEALLVMSTIILALSAVLQWRALVNATRTSERAWVTVKAAQFGSVQVGSHPTVNIVVHNTGKSPATELSINGNIGYFAGPVVSGAMPLGRLADFSVGVLGPGTEWSSSVASSQLLTNDDIADIKAGRRQWYAFGIITYQDIFGVSHRTDYCFRPDPANPTAAAGQVCNQWNTIN